MGTKRRRPKRSAASHKTVESREEATPPVVSKRQCSRTTVECNGGLQWMLGADAPLDAFRKTYFEKKPLHVKRESALAATYYSDLADLATPDALFSLMDQGVVPVYRINMYRCVDGSTKEEANPPPSSVDDARRLFNEGWSIQWLQPQQEHDALARLVAVLESEFGSLVGVNAYLTPPKVQGLAPHYDDVEVFVMQLGGTKSWNLHSSTIASPLPPEAQTLPRYSSGDLSIDSLSPVMLKPVLNPGDLLYLPRGTIHYAPNHHKTMPSVHLTISTLQQQSLYDLVNKSFEEAMSEMWETDESLRRSLPQQSFNTGSSAYPKLCVSVSEWFRRVADHVDAEAKGAAKGDTAEGPVAGALADLSAEFVKHRMPPQLEIPEADSCSIVTTGCHVEVVDTSAFALLPLPGEDGDIGSAKLIHCIENSRRNHMMRHPDARQGGAGGAGGEESGEEEQEAEDEEEAENEESEEEEDGADDDEDGGQIVSLEAAAALKELCVKAQSSPIASRRSSAAMSADNSQSLASLLLQAKVPESSWPEVCNLLTQLSVMGLVRVGTEKSKAVAKDNSIKKNKKKRTQ